MKKIFIIAVFSVLALLATNANAQEWSTGADLYSSYVWRGSKIAGASIQPYVDFSWKGLSVGTWGSVSLAAENQDDSGNADPFFEMDGYIAYGFNFGLTIGGTLYYYPMNLDDDGVDESNNIFSPKAAMAPELNIGYVNKRFNAQFNYIPFDNRVGDNLVGPCAYGDDWYAELGWDFDQVSVFAGGGSGWHCDGHDFEFVNVGLTTTREIKITNTFKLPVSGSVIVNPYGQTIFTVFSIAL